MTWFILFHHISSYFNSFRLSAWWSLMNFSAFIELLSTSPAARCLPRWSVADWGSAGSSQRRRAGVLSGRLPGMSEGCHHPEPRASQSASGNPGPQWQQYPLDRKNRCVQEHVCTDRDRHTHIYIYTTYTFYMYLIVFFTHAQMHVPNSSRVCMLTLW